MRKLLLLITLLLCSCGSKDSAGEIKILYYSESLDSSEAQMFELVNNYRASKGLRRLLPSNEAIKESQDHSHYMAHTLRSLTHWGFKKRVKRIRQNTDGSVVRSGENIAYNSSTVKAHQALLNSHGHRKNIEGDFTHMGVGEETDNNGRMYFTQFFIKID